MRPLTSTCARSRATTQPSLLIASVVLALTAVAGCASQTDDASTSDEAEIVAGRSVAQAEYDAEYPWMLAMAFRGGEGSTTYSVECGAELIAPDVVLTAGHCVTSSEGGPMVIGARAFMFARGDVNRKEMSDVVDGRTTFAARRVDRHPRYDDATLDYDVALIRLKAPQPGPYASLSTERLTEQSVVRAIGWGDTRRHKASAYVTPRPAQQLQRTALAFVAPDTCRDAYAASSSTVSPRMVCANGIGLGEGGKTSGVCNGDSGGPLLVETANGLQIAGLSSWVNGCGTKKFPSVFARIDGPLRAWIDACVRDENACALPR